jgi:isocitrate dehydrogenase (NAD+)
VIEENTEDLYAGLEHEVVPGVVESLKIITERARRASRSSRSPTHGGTAGRRSRRAKANIMKLSDGLFDRARITARAWPDIR